MLQYPQFCTFHGSICGPIHTKPSADYTDHGFRAEIRQGRRSFVHRPFFRGDKKKKSHKVVYCPKDIENQNPWTSLLEEDEDHDHPHRARVGRLCFRSYRLAIGNYGRIFQIPWSKPSTQSSLVMTAVVNVMNRVNGVSEKDATIGHPCRHIKHFYYAAEWSFTNGNSKRQVGVKIKPHVTIISAGQLWHNMYSVIGGGGVAYPGCICK